MDLISQDIWEDQDTLIWAKHIKDDVVPKLANSKVVVSVLPETPKDVDVQLAVEIGLSLLFNIPLILLIRPGCQIPRGLEKVVVGVIEVDEEEDIDSVLQKIENKIKELKYKIQVSASS